MSAPAIRVIVADDQQIMREGLVALLDLMDGIEVIGNVSNGEEALRVIAQDPPDAVLMDLRMPVLDGIETTRRIAAEHPSVAVLVLTTYVDDESIAAALHAGAKGYVTKDAGREQIAAALRAAAAGQITFDAAVSQRLVAALTQDTPTIPAARGNPSSRTGAPGLTTRESEVLSLIARGLSNAEIAAAMLIGEATVKTHANNVFMKIGVRNRSEAVRYVYQHGLAD
ncbi:response regulator transcription factor [Amycolatopsis sp. OK19-0408]|uniref:Response regulator transcription factor n=1 Tax=Amycolatopsis iheyensis TaxID=2945988 RepID=A0A9X2SHJ5_9PSEU|nr:response regulator transcription factor [Amycolatopsis iheyensis]MCR6481898.1 response regulator transcription factor [Amycolatopsis iheyensis]